MFSRAESARLRRNTYEKKEMMKIHLPHLSEDSSPTCHSLGLLFQTAIALFCVSDVTLAAITGAISRCVDVLRSWTRLARYHPLNHASPTMMSEHNRTCTKLIQ